ncbi:probable glutamyl endopeptidase, chloroplastic isoform X2 [Setaria viridis]|uniref:probable glutamyl endopeptidase, chloroplastic isoform X2 n=1 Tax=Setaria viridis TaxID=4556 RepID=UPI001493CB2F|nr:probable glutamyl endopeptidase, chloroplastic isoform X2 [Setaria viridis]
MEILGILLIRMLKGPLTSVRMGTVQLNVSFTGFEWINSAGLLGFWLIGSRRTCQNLGYRLPPKEIQEIVDVPPNPSYYISPRRDRIMFLKRRAMPPLSDLAKPDKILAGIRIDPSSNTRSRMSFYTGISIHLLMDDGTLGPEKAVNGYNANAKINFVGWSPDGQHVAFTVRYEDEVDNGSNLALWIADAESGKARPLFKSADIMLNAVFELYVWVNESSLLVCTIPSSRGDPPTKPLVPFGPRIRSNEQRNIIQMRSTKEMLKDLHEEELFDYYATSQIVLVTLDGTVKMIALPAIYISLDPSPDGKYLILTSVHRPYSSIVSYKRFPKKVELWTVEGRFVREVCDLPLAEDIPVAANSVRKGKRLIRWRPDMPSTLFWVEAQDGGDANIEVSPRDIVYMEHAEPLDGEKPQVLLKLDLRCRKTYWCYGSFALVYEYWYKTRITRTWVISPDLKNHRPRLLFERSSEDAYSNPGSPVMCRTPAGTVVIARIKRNCEGSYILLKGRGATPKGSTPFLDLFDVNTGEKERIWESDKEKYYESILALISYHPKCEVQLDQLKLLVSKESRREITQYYIKIWPNKKQVQITNYPHPYPQLALLQKEIIRYQRKDGVKLTATLYLPPGYSPSEDGPLPCLIWSYPGEFKSKEAAGQVRRSPNKFARISNNFPLLWLARGFAILADPTIPIIGEGNQEGNDRYIEQLVASAEAAVNEIVRRGVAHPDKIAVGGHSYGAFMTANLLAHAPHLFCCGIARSGAYNRTLTPFGFQKEMRTLWEATDTYIKMSPFMSANKIKKPILLIHGEDDSKVTTAMQSSQFYDALKGHGVPCRLVILPFERHQYAARESIMHIIWETDRWLQKYCATNPGNIKDMETNVDTSQSPNDAVLDHEALTLNFTKISSLIKLIRLAFAQIVFRKSKNNMQ